MGKSRIMIVDDNNLILEITGDVLEEAGFEVIKRSNPMGTTAAVKHEKPDCILLDINMPGLSGDKLVDLIKKNNGEKIKIILHSDRCEAELKKMTDETGADGYFKKSWGKDLLVKKVRSILSN